MKKATILLIMFIGFTSYAQTSNEMNKSTREQNLTRNQKRSSNGLPIGLRPIDSALTPAGYRRIYCENGKMHVYTSTTGTYGSWSESTTDPHVGRSCDFKGYRE